MQAKVLSYASTVDDNAKRKLLFKKKTHKQNNKKLTPSPQLALKKINTADF